MKLFLFTVISLLSSSVISVEIYECKDEHNVPYFSQTPCGPNAVVHDIKSTTNNPTDSKAKNSAQPDFEEEYKNSKLRSKIRSIDLKIKKLQSDINSLNQKRDKEINIYQKKIKRNEEKAGKNIKKAALRNKAHNERVVSIQEKYARKIEKKQNQIDVLSEEKESIQ